MRFTTERNEEYYLSKCNSTVEKQKKYIRVKKNVFSLFAERQAMEVRLLYLRI